MKKYIIPPLIIGICLSSTFCFGIDWNIDADGNWSTITSWNPNTVPNNPGDIASFGAITTSARTVTVDGTFDLGTLEFLGPFAYNLTAGTLNLNTGVNIPSLSGENIVDTDLVLGGAITFTANSNNLTTFSGNISGAGSIDKQGTNTLTLSGNNTFTGGLTISSGTVVAQYNTNQPLGTGTVTISNESTLIFSPFLGAGTMFSNSFVLDGGGSFYRSGSTGVVVAGTISGTGPLSVSGDSIANPIVLSGANNYTGETTIGSGGRLNIQNLNAIPGDITVSGGVFNISILGAPTYSNNITASGGTIEIGNDLTLSGNNSFSNISINIPGGVTLEATSTSLPAGGVNFFGAGPTLLIDQNTDGTTSARFSNGSGVSNPMFIKRGTGTVTLDSSIGSVSFSGSTTIEGGALNITNALMLGNDVGTLILDGGNLEVGESISLGSTGAKPIEFASTGAIDVLANKTLTSSGTISGTGVLDKQGEGTLAISGTNTYEGGTMVNMGTLSISDDTNLGLALTGVSLDGAIFNGMATTTVPRDITLSSPSSVTSDMSTTLTLSGIISGTGPLTKNGAGTVALSGANTYIGGTAISGGTLSLGADINLGDSGGGILLSGGATLNANNTFSSARSISLSGTGIIDVDMGETLTLSGSISDGVPGALEKSGTGILILSGTNSYTGGTTVTGGTLESDSDSLQGNIVNNANTVFNQTSDGTYAGIMSGTGAFVKTGASRLILTGTNTYQGGTTISSGVLEGTTNSIQGDVTNNSILELNQATMGTYSGNVSGTGELVKSGSGTVTLLGNSTYTGGTTINRGALRIQQDNNLGDPSSNLTLNGTSLQTFGTFSSSRAITVSSGGTFNIDPTTTFTATGIIGGSGGLICSGSGTLVLSGNNTYTGGTTINGITVEVDADNRLGGVGDIIFNGGTLHATSSFTSSRNTSIPVSGVLAISSPNTLTFSGVVSGLGSLIKSGTGILDITAANTYMGGTIVTSGTLQGTTTSLQGPIANNGTVIFNQGVTGTYGGTISGAGAVRKEGSGNVTFSGNNSYTGGTTVTNGVLTGTTSSLQGTIINNSSVIFDQNGDGTFAGVMSGSGSLTKDGTGDVTLGGTNSYAGMTIINGGALSISADNNLGNANGTIIFNGGALNPSALNITSNRPMILQAGGGTLEVDLPNQYTNSGDLSGTGVLAKSGTGALILTGNNSYTGGTTISAGTLQGNTVSLQGNILNNASLVFNQPGIGTFSDVISGTGSITKQGSSTLTLSGNNTYSGNTSLLDGTLSISADNNLGGAGSLILNAATLQTTANFTMARDINLLGAATVNTALGTTMTHSGTIMGTASGSLTKSGGGNLILSGPPNTYSGTTTILAGAIQVGNDAFLGGGGNLIINNGGQLNTTGSFSLNRNVILSSGDGVMNVDPATMLTLSGPITGTGRLVKLGTGTLTLTGSANTYSGGNTISAGILQGNTIGLQGDILDNSTLMFDQAVAGNFGGAITGTGAMIKQGTGTLTLSGTNTYTGGTAVNAGILQGSATSIQGDISNNATLTFNQIPDGIYTGILTGSGTLNKTGSGRLVVSNNSPTYTGNVVINSGALQINGNMQMSPITINTNGILEGNGTVGTVVNSGGVSAGASIGTLNIAGDYTQNSNGSLIIELNHAGNSDVINVSGTANLAGSISILPQAGIYPAGQTYPFLNATNIVGIFDQIIENHPQNFFVIYTATQASIIIDFSGALTPIPVSTIPGNPGIVGQYFFPPNSIPSDPDLLMVEQLLVSLSPEAFVQALDQLHPAQFGAMSLASIQNSVAVAESFSSQIERDLWCQCCGQDCPPSKQRSMWIEPIGNWYHQQEIQEQIGFNVQTYGLTMGGSYRVFNRLNVGGGLGYTQSNIHWKESRGKGNWDSYYVAPSAGWVFDSGFVNLMLLGVYNHYSLDRNIRFPGLHRTAHHHHYSYDLVVQGSGGYSFNIIKRASSSISVVPEAKASYINNFQGSFTENGAKSLNLNVSKKYSAFFQSELLVKLVQEIKVNKYCISPHLQLGWVATAPLSSSNITSRFYKQDLPTSHFVVKSFHKVTNQLNLGTGVYLTDQKNFSLDIGYKTTLLDKSVVQTAKVKGEWLF